MKGEICQGETECKGKKAEKLKQRWKRIGELGSFEPAGGDGKERSFLLECRQCPPEPSFCENAAVKHQILKDEALRIDLYLIGWKLHCLVHLGSSSAALSLRSWHLQAKTEQGRNLKDRDRVIGPYLDGGVLLRFHTFSLTVGMRECSMSIFANLTGNRTGDLCAIVHNERSVGEMMRATVPSEIMVDPKCRRAYQMRVTLSFHLEYPGA
ncbi:uncharacterized protein BJX67DRAFT_188937 [Aspergillus lucknowensis]|uniref:Uncharacterized protein n=1 Tax=Aspergillus lucknowensis TaxID=176173 RepID=A0ABR4LKR7_9EURO